jgi:hypothetical protein
LILLFVTSEDDMAVADVKITRTEYVKVPVDGAVSVQVQEIGVLSAVVDAPALV